jgi:hypothetical protein
MQLGFLGSQQLGKNMIFLDRQSKNRGQPVDASVYDLNEAMETIIRKHGKN